MAKSGAFLIVVGAVGLICSKASAQADGHIVSTTPFQFPGYSELLTTEKASNDAFDEERFRKRMPEALWSELRSNKNAHCSRLTYMADRRRVVGYMCQPTSGAGPFPAFIYSKGEPVITPMRLLALRRRASQGQLVITTELRGNGGSEGVDDYSGAELDDFLALARIISQSPSWDRRNLFAYGAGRGATIIVNALKRGMPLTAAAVHSLPKDLDSWAADEPELKLLLGRAVGTARGSAAARFWSAADGAARINTPLLIVGGTRKGNRAAYPRDLRILPVAAGEIELARELQRTGKRYELIIFDGDVLSREVDEKKDAIIKSWFEKMKR